MSEKKPQLLIFGATTPSRTVAAGTTTQLALYFSAHAAVTLVISDHAPPAQGFPVDIAVLRERDLNADPAPYKTAKRLYILDDSHESLFALRFLQDAPGPWINTDTTLHNLVKAHYQTQPGWPDSYIEHMETMLGVAGRHIGHSLSGDMRVSKVIASEITGFNSIGHTAFHIEWNNQRLHLPATHQTSQKAAKNKDCFDIVTIGDSCIQTAGETLRALDKQVNVHELSGSEPNLASLIAAADAVCLLDHAYRLPPAALALCLQTGKTIITANQPWARLLPKSAHLTVPGQHALHHLVAAIGSLMGNSTIRPWLETEIRQFADTCKLGETAEELKQQILECQLPALKLKPATAIQNTSAAMDDADETSLETSGPKRPFALIGAVPPQALMTQLYPMIDWEKSPRFATPELAAALSEATGKPAPVILALLGFESPLIMADGLTSPAKEQALPVGCHKWEDIQKKLKVAPDALTFDCSIEGVPKVRSLTPKDTQIPGGLTIDFGPNIHEDIKRQPSSGLLEKSGTYWQINQTEHRIDCLIICGVPGTYNLSLDRENTAFMIADNFDSALVQKNVSTTVKTNHQGIMQFSIGAAHPVNFYPLPFDELLKTLATTPLNLEWCSYG